jgi:apolipoprotein D and lipocalin family protein
LKGIIETALAEMQILLGYLLFKMLQFFKNKEILLVKKIIFAAVLPALLTFSMFVLAQKKSSDNKTELQTVSSVDLKRYTGKWYEIARYPNKFQKKCVGNTTTIYTAKADGNLAVSNQCVLKDGTIGRADGEAKVTDTISNAKFEMKFAPRFKSFLSLDWDDYLIVDLDENYQYAAAADPKRENLWILSRTPEMKDAVYQNILRRVEKLGFVPGRLTKTPQNLEVIKGEVIQKQ